MFGRKRPQIKAVKDEELILLIYRVRDQMASQRKLVASFRDVDEQTKASVALSAGLFDFLHRQARVRAVSGEIVSRIASEQLAEFRDQ